ncbi:fluoride efflux transporter CrcB [Permianibacter sp. IMCC34836]|uniref:fluoride efflux transporter CrcB n=1 Tax=Permianibacter fluminis TaxID=2738515 RepID=UPI0015554489|nr:fluoride efflux transporter CrcB [Permianibacter fluminis]NQD37837.1 fluoride efflux transporter CrcB [Permianibacter fluminis]
MMASAFAPLSLLAVSAGAVLGALLRYLANVTALHYIGHRFPWATLAVNLLGCFLAGALLAWVMRGAVSETGRLFWMVGFLGALTTFSAFSVETLTLLQSGALSKVAVNIGLNVVGSLLAVTFGFWLVRDVLS